MSFYGRDAADAQFLSKVYRLIMYRNSGPAISLTRIQQVEHESSVTQPAARRAPGCLKWSVRLNRAEPRRRLDRSRRVGNPL